MFDAYIEAWELRELVRKKELRPREVAEFYLSRIERLNPKLGAFMTVAAERALADAARLESTNAADAAAMPLYGVAYSLKDLTWTSDIRTTMGSKNFENFRPRADAELAVRLRDAGGILLGKTTTRNSAAVRPPRAACVRRRTIRGTSNSVPAAQAEVLRRRSRPGWVRWPKAPTAAARFACPRPAAASSGSSPRAGASALPR